MQYLNLLYDYTCHCDKEVELETKATILTILVFFYIMHLYKNILKDSKKLAKTEEVSK